MNRVGAGSQLPALREARTIRKSGASGEIRTESDPQRTLDSMWPKLSRESANATVEKAKKASILFPASVQRAQTTSSASFPIRARLVLKR